MVLVLVFLYSSMLTRNDKSLLRSDLFLCFLKTSKTILFLFLLSCQSLKLLIKVAVTSYQLFYEKKYITALVDLHTPKMLIIQFHTTKIIIIQFHTSSVWRKCLSYNFHTFSKNNRKKVKPFLRLFENS